ncbi:hypothetical protein [Paenibacillus abyssi]|uniref:Uncharacterized protein n=1 Tax=Paenibacillus abyssi TaxID=1340531 RepID=A0A917G2F6_9BACL|nr:hypothetical protein [Paenibacillus abyssi]GGG19398.1 hypothetical protein GCM10010916_40280 [Paenibacillus abyssi]
MCVLCGGFVLQEHWTEKSSDDGGAIMTVGGDSGRNRQRQRLLRTNMANRILGYYGLKMEDWNGSKYILRDSKGSSEIVYDLGSLWPAVEKMIRKAADPLDPQLIERMQENPRI